MKAVFFFIGALAVLLPELAFPQGITSGTVSGKVLDQNEEPLIRATIKAVHTPSGTTYSTVSRKNGLFTLPNMRVGGPYTISVRFVGFEQWQKTDAYVKLGENQQLIVQLKEKIEELETVIIAGTQAAFTTDKNGAATDIPKEIITNLPTIDRALQDFIRLTPQNTGGLSFLGRNNYYNNLAIDGSVFNNAFGLATLPGGQTDAQPISLDAIEAIRVSLVPYDVRQSGFTGADIQAVTRSGTNNVEGSVYGVFRNEAFVGDKVGDIKQPSADFSHYQSGFRLGGPLVKDKLFFFVNGEFVRRREPAPGFRAARAGLFDGNVSDITAADLDNLQSVLITKYGYDPGPYEAYSFLTSNDKFLAKLNWNISQNHTGSIRYNYLNSWKERPYFDAVVPSRTTMPFRNAGYIQNEDIHSLVAELNSFLGAKFSNQLKIGFTSLNGDRESLGSTFPAVEILNATGGLATAFGFEPFSANNLVNQKIWHLTNDFSIYQGSHTITMGASSQLFSFENSFTPYWHGYYRFATFDDFLKSVEQGESTVAYYQLTYSAVEGVSVPKADLNVLQLGFYLQDEWQLNSKFTITGGMRVDIPTYPTNLPRNEKVERLSFRDNRRIDVSRFPNAQLHWSPRISFKYTTEGDMRMQLRGGTGIFTGRPRFVWLIGQALNNGVLLGNVARTNPTDIPFKPDRTVYVPSNPVVPPVVEINVADQDFKFPQVWRSGLGIDIGLGKNFVGTLEGVYTKDINAVIHTDINLAAATGTLGGADTRPFFDSNKQLNSEITNAFLLDNVSKGRQYSLMAQISKPAMKGWFGSLAYTYTNAKDLTSNPNSIAYFAWGYNPVKNSPNDPEYSWSTYDMPHRVIGYLSYQITWGNNFKTTFSAVYNGQSGNRFSYVYGGDVNNDGIFLNNDLIYVPASASEINLVPSGPEDSRTPLEIWQQLDQFIAQDEYLDRNRGKIVPRNGGLQPWFSQVDIRLLQDGFTQIGGKQHNLQLSVDILNVGNLLNSSWGIRELVVNPNFLNFVGYTGENEPQFSFPLQGDGTPLRHTFQEDRSIFSRWRMQLGLRYSFN
ncbi:MAG: carboxypeptidase regulatory-like domain-containing protein [Fulvivirga sp.]